MRQKVESKRLHPGAVLENGILMSGAELRIMKMDLGVEQVWLHFFSQCKVSTVPLECLRCFRAKCARKSVLTISVFCP